MTVIIRPSCQAHLSVSSVSLENLEETLKSTRTLLFVLALFVPVLFGSAAVAQSAPPARTDLYHVHFAKAALGKAVELADYLKAADPKVPMSAHHIVLRHQDGEDWDYAVIEHLGTKTTVEAAGTRRSCRSA